MFDRSFTRGMARTISFWGILDDYSELIDIQQDNKHIEEDFNMIGSDLAEAIKKYSESAPLKNA